MTWLTATPMTVVETCAEALPRLGAEEALLASTVGMIGSGAMRKARATSILSRWERAARGSRRSSVRATPADVRSMGIGYREAPRRG